MNRSSTLAARVSIAAAVGALALLASLHFLSPEFAPSWRMVSEYANGHFGWVLALMFAAWGLSSWALAAAMRMESRGLNFTIGLVILAVSGIGEAMAAVFDINHDLLHGIAGVLGIGGMPIAATMLAISLWSTSRWSRARWVLVAMTAATWASLVLLGLTFVLLTATFNQVTHGHLPSQAPKVLPAGVIGLIGWANRLLVAVYCGWLIVVAWKLLTLPRAPQGAMAGGAPELA